MEVGLFASLREDRGRYATVEWFDAMDGYALLRALDIKEDNVAIFLINGVRSDFSAVIKPDDVIALFPPVGGG